MVEFVAATKTDIMTRAAAERLLLSEREAAKMLGICAKSLWLRTTPRGDVPCVRIGSRVLYSVESLRQWIKAQEAAPAESERAEPAETEVSR